MATSVWREGIVVLDEFSPSSPFVPEVLSKYRGGWGRDRLTSRGPRGGESLLDTEPSQFGSRRGLLFPHLLTGVALKPPPQVAEKPAESVTCEPDFRPDVFRPPAANSSRDCEGRGGDVVGGFWQDRLRTFFPCGP